MSAVARGPTQPARDLFGGDIVARVGCLRRPLRAWCLLPTYGDAVQCLELAALGTEIHARLVLVANIYVEMSCNAWSCLTDIVHPRLQ